MVQSSYWISPTTKEKSFPTKQLKLVDIVKVVIAPDLLLVFCINYFTTSGSRGKPSNPVRDTSHCPVPSVHLRKTSALWVRSDTYHCESLGETVLRSATGWGSLLRGMGLLKGKDWGFNRTYDMFRQEVKARKGMNWVPPLRRNKCGKIEEEDITGVC